MLNRVFKALSYRDFRLMWIGACTSSIGSWMQTVAQAWLVYTLSNDPFYLGLDAFLGQAPIILFSLVGGVIADRRDRRNMLLMSQYIQMTSAFILTALFYFHQVQVWHILCLSFVTGVGQSFGGPAYQALLPTLVGQEDFSNAIAWNSIQFNLARIVGPTLAGITLKQLNATWCFGLNGLSFLAVITSLYVIKVGFIPSRSTESILHSMKQGISFIRKSKGLDSLIVLAFCLTLFAIPLLTFIPVFAKEVFRGDETTFTRLLVCSGAGSVCGALLVAASGKVKRQGRVALLALIALGGIIVAFSFSKSLLLSSVLIFCSGAALMWVFSMVQSLVQAITGDAMRGRVMSVYNVAFRGGMPVGSLLFGKLIPVFTVSVTMACSGGLLAALGLYLLLVHRRIATL
ncbi:MAG TPA: MFS transporter [Bryobacteraceae bacterium]|nr:MFS transporter [Bryobacteraceae bacterium]